MARRRRGCAGRDVLNAESRSALAALEQCLANIDAREDAVGAWVALDRDGAIAQARALDARRERGPLHGMVVGVKDVIDTADFPTECGSPIYAGHRPAADALCVRRLRDAGAIVLGKTVTATFAFMQPGKTHNPHDLDCTPGGSSSGSAAAVAASMATVTLATQTGGSTIRPAAHCGVVGYKPAFDRIPTAGLKHLAPSIDTIGVMARTVEEVARATAVMAGESQASIALPSTPPTFLLCRTPYESSAEPQTLQRLDAVASGFQTAGARVRPLELPASFAALNELHRVIMSYETARSMAHEWQSARDALDPDLAAFIERGRKHTSAEADAARAALAACRRELRSLVGSNETILTLATPGEAPRGIASTGNAIFCRLWTLLGVPCIALPAGRGERGLPLAVQLVGLTDAALLPAATWAENTIRIAWGDSA